MSEKELIRYSVTLRVSSDNIVEIVCTLLSVVYFRLLF